MYGTIGYNIRRTLAIFLLICFIVQFSAVQAFAGANDINGHNGKEFQITYASVLREMGINPDHPTIIHRLATNFNNDYYTYQWDIADRMAYELIYTQSKNSTKKNGAAATTILHVLDRGRIESTYTETRQRIIHVFAGYANELADADYELLMTAAEECTTGQSAWTGEYKTSYSFNHSSTPYSIIQTKASSTNKTNLQTAIKDMIKDYEKSSFSKLMQLMRNPDTYVNYEQPKAVDTVPNLFGIDAKDWFKVEVAVYSAVAPIAGRVYNVNKNYVYHQDYSTPSWAQFYLIIEANSFFPADGSDAFTLPGVNLVEYLEDASYIQPTGDYTWGVPRPYTFVYTLDELITSSAYSTAQQTGKTVMETFECCATVLSDATLSDSNNINHLSSHGLSDSWKLTVQYVSEKESLAHLQAILGQHSFLLQEYQSSAGGVITHQELAAYEYYCSPKMLDFIEAAWAYMNAIPNGGTTAHWSIDSACKLSMNAKPGSASVGIGTAVEQLYNGIYAITSTKGAGGNTLAGKRVETIKTNIDSWVANSTSGWGADSKKELDAELMSPSSGPVFKFIVDSAKTIVPTVPVSYLKPIGSGGTNDTVPLGNDGGISMLQVVPWYWYEQALPAAPNKHGLRTPCEVCDNVANPGISWADVNNLIETKNGKTTFVNKATPENLTIMLRHMVNGHATLDATWTPVTGIPDSLGYMYNESNLTLEKYTAFLNAYTKPFAASDDLISFRNDLMSIRDVLNQSFVTKAAHATGASGGTPDTPRNVLKDTTAINGLMALIEPSTDPQTISLMQYNMLGTKLVEHTKVNFVQPRSLYSGTDIAVKRDYVTSNGSTIVSAHPDDSWDKLSELIAADKKITGSEQQQNKLVNFNTVRGLRMGAIKELYDWCTVSEDKCLGDTEGREYAKLAECADMVGKDSGTLILTLHGIMEHHIATHLGVEEIEPPDDPVDPGSSSEDPNNPSTPSSSAPELYIPNQNAQVIGMDDRHYRPEITMDLSGKKKIDTPDGVTNTEVADAIAKQKQVAFWGTVLAVTLRSVGELLFIIVGFYGVLFVLTRTLEWIPKNWIRVLSFGYIDAMQMDIRKFAIMCVLVSFFAVLFVMGYAYDWITTLLAWLSIKFGIA